MKIQINFFFFNFLVYEQMNTSAFYLNRKPQHSPNHSNPLIFIIFSNQTVKRSVLQCEFYMLSSEIFPGFDPNSSQDFYTFVLFCFLQWPKARFSGSPHLDKMLSVLLWCQVCALVLHLLCFSCLFSHTNRLINLYQSCNPHEFCVGPQSSLVTS